MKTKKEIKAYIKKVEEKYQRNYRLGRTSTQVQIQRGSILWALDWVLDEEESK